MFFKLLKFTGTVLQRIALRVRVTPARFSYRCYHRQLMSKLFYGLELPPSETEKHCKSLTLMLYSGIIQHSHPGAYHLLPLGTRALEKLQVLVDDAMWKVGAQKLTLPCMTSGALWKRSGRWESTGAELITLQDRHSNDYCLAPTHEEVLTDLVAQHCPLSYRQLPLRLYQIGRKFRDEMHPKHGLLRAREFVMKDLYTFDSSVEAARETYSAVTDVYDWFFQRLQIPVYKVAGDVGNIGGHESHEYHVASPQGEDCLLWCSSCNTGANAELHGDSGSDTTGCQECGKPLEKVTGIEVGHLFLLGQKYSSIFKATFEGNDKTERVTEMGCYGIGVSRLLAAAVEALATDTQLRWPRAIAPLQVALIPQKEGHRYEDTLAVAEEAYDRLSSAHVPGCELARDVVLDDRTALSIGRRLRDASRLGVPLAVVSGKKALEDPPILEVHDLYTGEVMYGTMEQVVDNVVHSIARNCTDD